MRLLRLDLRVPALPRLRTLLLMAGATAALAVVACGDDDTAPAAAPAPTAASAPTAVPAPTAAPAERPPIDNDLAMAQTQASVVVPLGELNGSGQQGVALLVDKGDQTEVVIDLGPGPAGLEQPVHLHAGTCDNLGAVAIPLTNIVDGRSVTRVDAPFSRLTGGDTAINAHMSAEEIGTYVACGNVPRADKAATFSLNALNLSGQPGSVTFIDRGGETAVVISVGPAEAGLAQPVHIHEGSCDNLGAVAIPLANIVDGRSVTIIDDSISNVLKDGFAVNAHRSGDDIGTYVACGDLSAGFAATGDSGGSGPVTVMLGALSGSGQSGAAVLTPVGDGGESTEVVVNVTSGPAGLAQPIHIHAGSCDNLGGIDWPLENVVGGESTTIVDASLADILSAERAINLHRSADEIGTYTACGDLGTSPDGGTAPADPFYSDSAPASAPAPGAVMVASDIEGFKLQNLTIDVGTAVTWTNLDNAPHTVSHGVSPNLASPADFDSTTLTKGQTFTHVFNTAGTFAYFCRIHPQVMIAQITVK